MHEDPYIALLPNKPMKKKLVIVWLLRRPPGYIHRVAPIRTFLRNGR